MVTKFKGKYVVDNTGKAVSVLIDIRAYRRMLRELEELEAIRAYDAAKASHDDTVPFEEAVQQIEKSSG